MASITQERVSRNVVVGVDTHKFVHVAVVLDEIGGRLDCISVDAATHGYSQLEKWATSFGAVTAFGVEGTGSYGAGLARYLRRHGHRIIEVNRPDRRIRRQRGKSDTVDAENAARAVLNGQATAVAKIGVREVEMIRHIKIARDTAVKARMQAVVTLKSLLVSAPAELRESLEPISGTRTLLDRCAGLRPGDLHDPVASAKHALRSLARRWIDLDAEIKAHDEHLHQLVKTKAPRLLDAFGIGPDTAAELLLIVGDNAERIAARQPSRSSAACAQFLRHREQPCVIV